MYINQKHIKSSSATTRCFEPIMDVTNLEYLNFNTSNPGQYFTECNSAYELWKKIWLFTYSELGIQKKLTSEDFLNRQICGLFNNGNAIGFLLHHQLDLKLSSALDSNYFDSYPDQLKQYQITKNDSVFIVSFMTINPDWRKSVTNFSISELLLSFAVLEFNFTKSKRILGYFRNNRSINDVFYRHAGKFLCKDIAHNIEVDFGEIYQHESHLSEFKDHALISLKLWQNFKNKQKKESTHGITQYLAKRTAHTISPKFSFPRLEQ